MSVDSKIRPAPLLPTKLATGTTPAVTPSKPTTGTQPAVSTGFSTASTFVSTPKLFADDSLGRRAGQNDDGVGRKAGQNDDGVGRRAGQNDDGVGKKAGQNDDGVGKKAGQNDDGVGKKAGQNDDGVGEAGLRSIASFPGSTKEIAGFIKGSTDVAGQVSTFAKAQGFSATEQTQLSQALQGASPEAAKLLGAIAQNSPQQLKNVDSKGQTLLSNLAKFNTQTLGAAGSETNKAELYTSMLRDIANPERVAQGDAPTCTVTSMQYELVGEHPSEYVRLLSGLSGPTGRVAMDGNSELQFQPGDAKALDGRPVSQAIFQSAAMEFGNGKELKFDPAQQGSFNASGELVQRGLRPAQQTQVLGQLFGTGYRSERFQTPAEAGKVLEKLKAIDGRENVNRPILLQIDQGDFNHAVTYERVANGDVQYRDPYGTLRSMTETEFKNTVVGMNAPKDLNVIN